jgi:hypothetical protein
VTRDNHLSIIVWVVLAAGLTMAEPVHALEEEALRDLGQPITSITVADVAYGQGADGKALLYLVVRGSPARLNVIDVLTGERVGAYPIDGAIISWGAVTAPDGVLYIGSQRAGNFYRYRPGSDAVENLGVAIEGESHHWGLAVDAQGRVYGGTYPGGKVFRFDPATEQFRHYGRLAEGEDYVRSVAYGDDGMIYAGTGARSGKLFRIDPESGESTEIALPEEAGSVDSVYELSSAGGLVFAFVTPARRTYVYSIAEAQWVDELAIASPLGPDGKVYYLSGRMLWTYDPQTRERSETGFAPRAGGGKGFGWLDLGDREWPGLSLVSSDMRGRYYIYNPHRQEGTVNVARAEAQGVPVRSLYAASDGRIWIGGYLSPGMAMIYDPQRDEFEQKGGVSQIEAFCEHDGIMYIGVYPRANIYAYDLAQEWQWGQNPRLLFNLVEQRQDRPFAFTPAGEVMAIGTVPAAGSLGGAITIYDPREDSHEVFSDIVENQSVSSLIYHDGMLIGGTTVSGGLGISPTAEEGRLFVWDMEGREKVWEGVPVPGERHVTGLIVDPDGLILGVAGRHLFQFDPATREVVRTKDLLPGEEVREPATVWVNGVLNFHEGMLYGRAMGRIFRLDPQTWESEVLVERTSYFAQDPQGRIYFSRGETLYQFSPSD